MALILLQVLVLGVIAAAVDDVPITWSQSPRSASLACAVAEWARVAPRRPPPPLDDDLPRPKPFVWWKGDDELSSKRISINGTLEVSRKANAGGAGGEGEYRCAVRRHGGLVMGYPVHLRFSHMDKQFSAQPTDVTAKLGQPLSLPCRISSGPKASISWTRNGIILPFNERYHILENELLITDVQREDAGLYRCIATNSYANRSKSSHEGRVVVEESQDEEPSFVPLLNEGNITAPRGSRVVLPCPMLGWPRPKLIWELTPPGGRTSELESTEELLVLTHAEFDQEGVYTCAVEGHSDLVKTFTVALTQPVNITLPPVSKETQRAGTVRFNCTATGKPEPSITWYKDGRPLALAGRIYLRNSADRKRMELVISRVTSDDAGIYQCFASNSVSVSSSWAQLNVTGVGAAPPGQVWCAPAAPNAVALRWRPAAPIVVAYTVDTTPNDKHGVAITGQPHTKTEEIVRVKEALTPYTFQVRAFISSSTNKNIASDMSESVVCQGQGVPVKLIKLKDDQVMVSWQQFSEETPGVAQWVLQYKRENGTDDQEHNVTLAAHITNYTLTAPPSSPWLVRVLGSRSLDWLPQNLSLVSWTSTEAARDIDDGEVTAVPQELVVTEVGARRFSIKWQCPEPSRYTFLVCVRRVDGNDECQESDKTNAMIEGLQPNSEYEVRVQVRVPGRALGGAFTAPFHVTTQAEGVKDLKYEFVNATTLRVSWGGAPANYTVHHSAELKLPVEQWAVVETVGNSVQIHNIDPTESTFVMVTGYDPPGHSPIISVPARVKDLEAKDLKYAYTSAGVLVWWNGAGPKVVRFAQNITQPLEEWASVNVTDPNVELNNLDASLPVYVVVTAGGARRHQVLTIPPRPADHYYFYLGIGLGCSACALCLAVAAFYLWRRTKTNRSPTRSRRTQVTTAEGTEEEGAEMKEARVANGAGEPLLNGHVHITENPASKTPNGRMKKGRRFEPPNYEAFDVSRHDADTTMETVLDDTTSYNLLDTSRRPEYDLSRSSRDISANNSFNKLPDDNMNSELTRSTEFQLDNSKIQPTLQPNG